MDQQKVSVTDHEVAGMNFKNLLKLPLATSLE